MSVEDRAAQAKTLGGWLRKIFVDGTKDELIELAAEGVEDVKTQREQRRLAAAGGAAKTPLNSGHRVTIEAPKRGPAR